jgi:hypothetical protein
MLSEPGLPALSGGQLDDAMNKVLMPDGVRRWSHSDWFRLVCLRMDLIRV